MLGTQEHTVRGGDAKKIAAVAAGIVGLGGVGVGAYFMGKGSCKSGEPGEPGGAGGPGQPCDHGGTDHVDEACLTSPLDGMELECAQQLLKKGTLQVEMRNGLSAQACLDALVSDAHSGLWPYNRQAIEATCRLPPNIDSTDEAILSRGEESVRVSRLKFPSYRCDTRKCKTTKPENRSDWTINPYRVSDARCCSIGAYNRASKKFDEKCTAQMQTGKVSDPCWDTVVSPLLQYRDEYVQLRPQSMRDMIKQ